jgi:hypothetical protein
VWIHQDALLPKSTCQERPLECPVSVPETQHLCVQPAFVSAMRSLCVTHRPGTTKIQELTEELHTLVVSRTADTHVRPTVEPLNKSQFKNKKLLVPHHLTQSVLYFTMPILTNKYLLPYPLFQPTNQPSDSTPGPQAYPPSLAVHPRSPRDLSRYREALLEGGLRGSVV